MSLSVPVPLHKVLVVDPYATKMLKMYLLLKNLLLSRTFIIFHLLIKVVLLFLGLSIVIVKIL